MSCPNIPDENMLQVESERELEINLEALVRKFAETNNVEIHSVTLYAYYSHVHNKICYACRVDARQPGQIMRGVSS